MQVLTLAAITASEKHILMLDSMYNQNKGILARSRGQGHRVKVHA